VQPVLALEPPGQAVPSKLWGPVWLELAAQALSPQPHLLPWPQLQPQLLLAVVLMPWWPRRDWLRAQWMCWLSAQPWQRPWLLLLRQVAAMPWLQQKDLQPALQWTHQVQHWRLPWPQLQLQLLLAVVLMPWWPRKDLQPALLWMHQVQHWRLLLLLRQMVAALMPWWQQKGWQLAGWTNPLVAQPWLPLLRVEAWKPWWQRKGWLWLPLQKVVV